MRLSIPLCTFEDTLGTVGASAPGGRYVMIAASKLVPRGDVSLLSPEAGVPCLFLLSLQVDALFV